MTYPLQLPCKVIIIVIDSVPVLAHCSSDPGPAIIYNMYLFPPLRYINDNIPTFNGY